MVGVPKSKSCSTCLKRMVKCDETKPYCLNCMKGKRECPGYDRGMKWVDEGPRMQMRYIAKVKRPGRRSTSTTPGSTVARESPRPCLLPSPFLEHAQLVSCFVADVYPVKSIVPDLSFLGSWLWMVPGHLAQSKALNSAALCLSLAYYEKLSGCEKRMERSRKAYGQALSLLSKSISDISTGLSSETLCATLLLFFYERFACTERESWIKHAGGAGRLMQVRGAKRHREGFDYAMFLAFRGMIIAEALVSGEPCFLDAEDWMSILADANRLPPTLKTFRFYNDLCNYFARVPRVVSRTKAAQTEQAAGTMQYFPLDLLIDAQRLRTNMAICFNQFVQTFDQSMPAFIEVQSGSGGNLFPSKYVYQDTLTAALVTSYSAYLIVLNSQINALHQCETQKEENLSLARDICMSVEYCAATGLCGAQCMTFSLPHVLPICPEEHRGWVKSWLDLFMESSMLLKNN